MIYDYKLDNTVQEVILDDICLLINDIVDEFNSFHRYNYLSIYVPSYIGRTIVSEILDKIEEAWIYTESHYELLYKDSNEVLITLASDGMIFIEDARNDFGTLVALEGSVLSYVYDGFLKKDIDLLSSDGDSILVFGFEDECCECCGECQCNEDTDVEDDTHGFTVSKSDENGYSSFSFYSSEELTKEDVGELLKRFGF